MRQQTEQRIINFIHTHQQGRTRPRWRRSCPHVRQDTPASRPETEDVS